MLLRAIYLKWVLFRARFTIVPHTFGALPERDNMTLIRNLNRSDTNSHYDGSSLIYVSWSSYGSDWMSFSHTHHFSEVFYILKGSGQFLVNHKTHHVKENDIILVNPFVEHTEFSSLETPMEYIVLGLDGILFQAGSNEIACHSAAAHKDMFRPYFDMLKKELAAASEFFDLACQSLANLLLINITRVTHKKVMPINNKNIPKECHYIYQYIQSNYNEDITLDTLADEVHLNKYYLSHAFVKAYGISPINYLIELRLQRCKELLVCTDHSIAQIAQTVGFSSQSYFCTIFKKRIGLSPSKFRKTENVTQQPLPPLTPNVPAAG